MSSDKDKKKGPAQRTGSVVPEDAELATWLHRLWARGEPPERLEVWQMFGRNKEVRGEMIHHEDFKPNEKRDQEQCVRLANEIVAAAQNDADGARKEGFFQIAVIDKHRKTNPLTRRIGPYQPKRAYLVREGGKALRGLDEDEDGGDHVATPGSAAALMLKHIELGFQQSQWDKTRYDRVMGEMLMLQGGIIEQQRGWISELVGSQMGMFRMLQEAEDRKLDRDVARKWSEFKVVLARDGLRTVRNLLPGLFAGEEGGGGGGGTHVLTEGAGAAAAAGGGVASGGGAPGGGAPSGAAAAPQAGRTYGQSPERALIDNLMSDIEEDEQLAVKLFGDFEVVTGEGGVKSMKQTKPGIFTVKQFAVMVGVREGQLPPEAVDQLVPMSGHENAITQKQIEDAGAAGVTEGMGVALLELVGLRNKRKEAAERAAAAQQGGGGDGQQQGGAGGGSPGGGAG